MRLCGFPTLPSKTLLKKPGTALLLTVLHYKLSYKKSKNGTDKCLVIFLTGFEISGSTGPGDKFVILPKRSRATLEAKSGL